MGGLVYKLMFFLIILVTLPIVLASNVQPLLKKDVGSEIFNAIASENYISAGAENRIYLLDINGNEIWSYTTRGNVTAVSISPREDYIVAASHESVLGGEIYSIDINGSLIKRFEYPGKISAFYFGKPNATFKDLYSFKDKDYKPVFNYSEKGYFMWIRPIEETPICTFEIAIATNQMKMLCEDKIVASPWTDLWTGIQYNTIWGLVYLPYNFTSYFEGGSVGLGTGLGKTYLGDQSNYSEFKNYTAIATRRDKEYILTLLDMANMTNRVVWQYNAENTIKNVNFFQNGSRILASSGNILYIFQNPLIKKPKPKIVLLANSIDYALASEFFGFLKDKGIEVTQANADNFEQYKNEKFIVILGGSDAYEGVGDVVKQVLTKEEQDWLREKGNRKMFVKANVWTQGQVVMVIAGNDRLETQKANSENKENVHLKIKG